MTAALSRILSTVCLVVGLIFLLVEPGDRQAFLEACSDAVRAGLANRAYYAKLSGQLLLDVSHSCRRGASLILRGVLAVVSLARSPTPASPQHLLTRLRRSVAHGFASGRHILTMVWNAYFGLHASLETYLGPAPAYLIVGYLFMLPLSYLVTVCQATSQAACQAVAVLLGVCRQCLWLLEAALALAGNVRRRPTMPRRR